MRARPACRAASASWPAGTLTKPAQARRVAALWPGLRVRRRRPPAPGPRVRGPGRRGRSGRAGGARRARRARARSARSASTITTTSRRADVQREVFRAQVRLARELGPAGRHPHARGRRRHGRDHPGGGRRGGRAACSTASPAPRRWPSEALDLGFYVSFSGIVTFPKAASTSGRRGAHRAARSAAGRDRLPVPGAGAACAASATSRPGSSRRRRRARRGATTTVADARRGDDGELRTRCSARDVRAEGRGDARSSRRVGALTPRAQVWSDERTQHAVDKLAVDPRADLRADPRRPRAGRARVRPPRRVARRADPGDRALHPGRAAASASGRRSC